MNTQSNNQLIVFFLLTLVVFFSACGTLEVDLEPTVSVDVAAESATETPQETNSVADVTPTAVELVVEEPVKVEDQQETTEQPALASEIIDLDETWNLFISHELGFTIRFPKEMAAMLGSCYWNEEQGSYRPEMAFVPVGIFEEADAVYIAPQYYFEMAGERVDGGKHYYDQCNQITNSLELVREEREMSMVQFWKLVAQDVRDEGELESFIKARYGSGCSLGEQVTSSQEGVFDVSVLGDGKDLGESQCPMNYAYKIKYFPAGGKVIAWNIGQAYTFLSTVDWSDGYDPEMIESFRFLTGTSVETAEEPLATVGYSNDETGIAFNYPTSWTMEEEANAFIFRQGSIALRVGYRIPGQTADLHGRTGMGGTGVGALEGTAQFLEQGLPKYGVYYDDVLKTVIYGGEPGAVVQSGAMEFTIVIDILDADYHKLTITNEIMAEAELILASFTVGSSPGDPVAGLNTYINDEYGFALNYPSTWTVQEVNGVDYVGEGSRSVQLSQGTVKLIIGYRKAGGNVAISGSGAPGGEFAVRGTVNAVRQELERYVIVYEGKDKVVMYNEPGTTPISAGGLEFGIRLGDFDQVNYEEVELSKTIQDEADTIVSSLAIIEATGASNSSDFSGWQTYTNDVVGYSLMVPAEADIVALDPYQRVAFVGPQVDGKPQFQFMVETVEASGSDWVDFRDQRVEGHRATLDSLGVDEEGTISEISIGGIQALRLRYPGTIAADFPRDDIYFIRGDTFFTISITLFDGEVNEALNDQFLQSITFQ